MIKFENVSLSFGNQLLLDDISFTLNKKEHCGLLGRNGSGKSTLLRLIIGEIEPDIGKIYIPNGYKIGYLQQHIKFSKPTILEEACLGLPDGEKENEYIAKRILFGLGFNDDNISLSPSSLSGGYHLRLHLAKVLISNPDCLLLDEPTNYLDIASIRWLKKFLSNWQQEFIFISHDREFMDSVTNYVMGINRKKIIRVKGNSINYFDQLMTQEMVYEKARIKTEKQKQHVQHFIERFGAKATKASQARSKQKMLNRIPVLEKLIEMESLDFSFKEAPFYGKNMVMAKNVSFSYTNEPLIQNLSLEIDNAQRIAIIGKNGYGKSTILKLLSGELIPQMGTLRIRENTQIGYFGQTNINNLKNNLSVEEEISSANPELNYSQIRGLAGLMMFSQDDAKKKIAVLSGGERSRVLLAKILAKPCNLLFLDEPTHHLDIESIEALMDAIEIFSGTVVIVTHSELILKRLELDQIIFCEKSKQSQFLGNYEDFLEKIGWEEIVPISAKKKDFNEEKKQRALKVAQRSKILSPIKKKIVELEEQITSLEKEQSENLKNLEGEPNSPNVIKIIGVNQKKLDELYFQLDTLDKEYEKEKAKLESE